MSAHTQPLEASDAEILGRVARGDVEAFGQFYDRHSTVLFSLAVKILRDHHEAEEALQEAMTLIWERAASYDAALGQPLSWAVTITRNKSIDRLRSTQRKSRLLTEAAPEIESRMVHSTVSGPGVAINGEAATTMREALGRLPAEQRQAIEMAFFGGLTHSEIATQLGHPLGTAKARIRRGMMSLRDSLEGRL
ncbi:MAG: sigma-70 family RNA polymerase sigma factor [Opitutaceae bacterium]|nr:sigma-70 family RNA polymerase sigma factor [Verrucomicrobiales bacterium]